MPASHRRAAALAVAGLLAALPAAAAAAPHGAAKKRKQQPTATVDGTFTVRWDAPGGFGNDHGPNVQTMTVELDKAKVPVAPGTNTTTSADERVTFTYHAEASTADRSWAVGCDAETIASDATWTGKREVTVQPATSLTTKGKRRRYVGWQVLVELPDAMRVATTGGYQQWDSLMEGTCTTTPQDRPLGMWSWGFASPQPAGKLADDGRSVPLWDSNTAADQTGTAKGSIRFSHRMDR